MAVVSVAHTFAATVPEADRLWCDTAGWPEWVDGVDTITHVDGSWPQVGAGVAWVSGPAGRGAVTERVTEREALATIVTAVADATIEGEQSVTFTPVDHGVRVHLSLAYRLRSRSPLMRIVDPLFIRRAMRSSLEATLARFGTELESIAAPPP